MKRVRRNKASAIVFIAALLLQTVFANLGMTLQVHAEGNEESIILADGVIVEEAEGEAVVQFDWTLNDTVDIEQTFTAELPENTTIAEEQTGELLYEEEQVGFFLAKADGKVSIQFDEGIEGLAEAATGSFVVDVVVGEYESEDPATEEVDEESGDPAADENDGMTEEDDEGERQESKEESAVFAEEPQAITENIIDEFILYYEDGTKYQDGDFLEIGEDLRFEIDWSLPNGHEYKNGDTFEFQLPKQLQIHNADSGNLGDYGTYEVTLDGKVTFTFNERIENESNVKGEFWFDTELEEQEIGSTNEHLEIIFNDDVANKIIINVKPTGGQAIHKEGQPVDGSFNTEEIEWTVLVNTTRDDLKNAIVNDPILEGQVLDLESIELQEVEVDLSGNITEELDVVTDFTNKSTEDELKLELGDTNKAYKLTFKTKMKEEEKDNEGWKGYPNTVYLNSDGQDEKESGASVSVNRPKSMEKTSSSFNKDDRSVEWTVNANFNEKNLSAGDEIIDEFTFTVGNEDFNDVFEIIEEDITIEQVDAFNDQGKPVEKSDATDLFEISIEGNKVTYKLKEDTNKAFVLNYKTQAKDGTIVNENGTIVNSIDLNGNTDTSSSGVVQQVGTKTNDGIDYENKTIDWTITINADKQDLRNFVLTDDFAGSGQKLVEDSIEISPEKQDATIGLNPADIPEGEGFLIDFGNITDTYTITYQTKFTYDFEGEKTPNFKNGVNISYETSDGDDYELEIGDEVGPNKETKSNGAKNGIANNETKEITWTVDINYNQLELSDAKVKDALADNQSLIDGSVKIYETMVGENGGITVGDDVTDQFTVTSSENQVDVDFGEIDQSYRVEFVTKDKDDIYNSDEVYENTAQFIPREGEQHDLWANVTLPNQGEFLGKSGLHNKEDWTVDWTIDVNKSKSTLTDVTVKDDLGSTDFQILLEDSIIVKKDGSDETLVEGEDYELTFAGNKLNVYFPGVITDAYEITYSSYIVAEDDAAIKNEAEIQSVDDVIVGSTEKAETVQVKISTGGGTGEGETGGLTIEKVETDTNRPLGDVAFELVKEVGSQKIVVREGTTDADGKLEWKGLKFGDYTLNEAIPEGYLGEEEQTVTISSDDPEGVKTLSIENERRTGTAKILKVDAVTGDELAGAEFKLTNKTTGQTYTLTTKENGEVSEDVPFGEYTVEEITAPNGYRITKDIDNITVEIDKTTEIEVTNEAIVEVAGQKQWFVDGGHVLPAEITVELYANGSDEPLLTEPVTAANDWNYRFTNLDKYDTDGNEIKYSIEEVELDGYVSEKDGYDLTNIQTIDISGEKIWDVVDEQHIPDLITVNLLANGEEIEGKSEEVTKDTDWKFTFEDLAKFNKEGEEIDYTIEEVDVNGYTSEIKDFVITNTQKTKKLSGEKIWQDNDDATGDRPEEITVQVMNGEEVVKEQEITAENNWKYTFTELPTHDKDGNEIEYTVAEKEVPEGYVVKPEVEEEDGVVQHNLINTRTGETDVSGEKIWHDNDDATGDRPEKITVNLLQNGKKVGFQEITAEEDWEYSFTGLDRFDENGVEWGYTIDEEPVEGYSKSAGEGNDLINTRVGETEVSGTKKWLDDGAVDERPESITVHLLQNGTIFAIEEVTAEDNWEYSFVHLPRFDENGVEWGYTIDEVDVDGYAKSADGNDLINTRVGETEMTGVKTWLDNDDATGDRPDSITVNLLQNGTLFTTAEVTADEDWEYSFTHLPEFDDQGVAYEYTVEEVVPKGYEATVEDYDITNLRVGTVDVSGVKTWVEVDNQYRPDSITVYLLANGETIDSQEVTVNEDGEWVFEFTDLPEFDSEGKAIEYTIEEEAVAGYTTEIEDFTITNTQETTELSGTKTWVDENDTTGDRPESITVQVMNGEEVVQEKEVTANDDGEWIYTFTDLPKYDKEGNEIAYTINELPIPGYITEVHDFDLTNIRSEQVDVEGKKYWQDDSENDRPGFITVQLFANGELFEEIDVTSENDWTYNFENLEAYDVDGAAIEYTVDEVAVQGYTTSINGYDITNTLNLEDEGDKGSDPAISPESSVDPKDPKGPDKLGDNGDGEKLPKTATNIFNFLLAGMILIALGLTALFVQMKRKQADVK